VRKGYEYQLEHDLHLLIRQYLLEQAKNLRIESLKEKYLRSVNRREGTVSKNFSPWRNKVFESIYNGF